MKGSLPWRKALRIFLAIGLLASLASGCSGGNGTGTDGPVPAPVTLSAASCSRDPASGDLVIRLDVVGIGPLAGEEVDATADAQNISVRATYTDGDTQELPWFMETTESGPSLTLRVTTTEPPSSLSIRNLTVTAIDPVSVDAAAVGSLEGLALVIVDVRSTIEQVVPRSSGIGIEFSISPAMVEPSLVVVGLQNVHAVVAGHRFVDQGISGSRGAGNRIVQAVVLLGRDDASVTEASGPATLAADGLMLQYPGPLEVAVPPCSS